MQFPYQSQVEETLNSRITNIKPLSGGCIAESVVLKNQAGTEYFCKFSAPEIKLRAVNTSQV